MKNTLLLLMKLPVLCFSQGSEFSSDLQTEKTPWTHLDFANDPKDFQFAIITDRTGSPRAGVFEDAVAKLNWMMPEFVITVGDLIRGAKGKDSVRLEKQWAGHFERIEPLKMPFFHLAGNHDIKANNDFQVEYWNKLFGAPYYAFVYQEVLFLCLFSNQGTQVLSEEQVAYFQKVVEQHTDARWTMVFLHHPLWRYPHMSNFDKIEELLQGKKYTVFAGHQHQYHHSVRDESNYYVLATTGGGSPLLGNSFGSFDHITWVTMSDRGPILANLRLDGILPHDVANDETHALTRELLQSIAVETHVLLDSEKEMTKGKAYVTYRNASDHPLFLEGRFFHHHQVLADPAELSLEIPAQSGRTVEIDLTSIQPFDTKENVQLEYQGSIGYQLEAYPDLSLSGSVVIPIQSASYPMLKTKEVSFIGSYEVEMTDPLPGTVIKYTMDGREPGFNSATYERAFALTSSTEVKARLFSADGKMKSDVESLMAKAIKPGKGLMVEHYPYELSAKSLGGMPDFNELLPSKITVTQELDPVKVSGRNDQFGLVYKGSIALPEEGAYTFYVTSDDGVRLLIDQKEVVIDAVKHKAREANGKIFLTKGPHPFELQYFQWKRNYALSIEYTTPGGERKVLSAESLSYDQNTMNDAK